MQICPRCDFENNEEVWDCVACGINMQWAKLNPDQWTKMNADQINRKSAERKREKYQSNIQRQSKKAKSSSSFRLANSFNPTDTTGKVAYDPDIIRQFVKALYQKANTIIVVYTILGVLIGCVIGGIGLSVLNNATAIGIVIGGLIGGVIGYVVGQDKAFSLKLQAQLILCQVQIEMNTRNSK